MSGGFWAGSVPPWASVIIVLVCMATFVLGVAAGMDLERRQAARDAREERADNEADEYLGQLRELPADKPVLYGRRRPRDTREDPDLIGKILRQAEVAHEWEPVHVGAALAVANGDPITTGEIRAITEDMDAFMGRLLGEHPVPYPDGSGQ